MERKKYLFKWYGAATWTLKVEDLTIASDPCLCDKDSILDFTFFKAQRMIAPVCEDYDFDNVDLWLITHNHEDHIDEAGSKKIDSDSEVVTHQNALNKLKHLPQDKVHVLNWHESITFHLKNFKIEIQAIPAIHGSNFISAYLAGGVNGYWIKLTKENYSAEFYIASDTVIHSKVISAVKDRKPDVLIANIGAVNKHIFGGPLTLTAKTLIDFSKIVQPQTIIPIHYDTFSHYKETVSELTNLPNFLIPGVGETVELTV